MPLQTNEESMVKSSWQSGDWFDINNKCNSDLDFFKLSFNVTWKVINLNVTTNEIVFRAHMSDGHKLPRSEKIFLPFFLGPFTKHENKNKILKS